MQESETGISKSETNSKCKIQMSETFRNPRFEIGFGLLDFRDLNLFRISIFRISYCLVQWWTYFTPHRARSAANALGFKSSPVACRVRAFQSSVRPGP